MKHFAFDGDHLQWLRVAQALANEIQRLQERSDNRDYDRLADLCEIL